MILGVGVVLGGCDDGSAGIDRPAAVTLTRVTAEIEGVSAPADTAPVELYGDSFAIVNGTTIVSPDSVLLFLDGEHVEKVEGERDLRVELPAGRFSEDEHILRLTGYKTLNAETKTGSDQRTLHFEK